jgi:hypothetical protein
MTSVTPVTRVLTTLLLLVLVLPVGADARRRTLAPPGNSAVSEYLETIPTDAGQAPPTRPKPPPPPAHNPSSGHSSTPSQGEQGGALTTGQSRSLDRLGSDGRTLAALVNATSPPVARGTAETSGAAGGSPRGLTDGGASSPFSSVLAAATGRDGGGGLGPVLPMLMLAGVVGVFVRILRRRRES